MAEKLGFNHKYISQCCAEFKREGIEKYSKIKCDGNHRSLSKEKEAEIPDEFIKEAEKGQVITVREIKEEFDKVLRRKTQNSYISNEH